MAQTIIEVECKDQVLTATYTPRITSGGINENKVKFAFCPLWDGFTKKAVFRFNGENPVETDIGEDNICLVPNEVVEKSGYLLLGVYGVNDKGIRRTSTVMKYKIAQGAVKPE